jgi:hypothetical protein
MSAQTPLGPSQPKLPYDVAGADITERKHQGNKQSESANVRVRPFKLPLRERCFLLIQQSGEKGATLHEIADALGAKVYTISARLSELKVDKRVFESGRARGNAAVLVTPEVKEAFSLKEVTTQSFCAAETSV